ncbi:hypothetical protein [Paraconexibacter sp.]|uniref:hypothetical protein n=1 Tax=Paraconexibacter sp. TaxID=2949640 RepID=UPI003567F05E
MSTPLRALPGHGWRFPAAALLLLAGVAIALGLLLSRTERFTTGPDVVVASIAVIAVTALPLVWRGLAGRLDFFEPIVISAVLIGLLFGVRPLIQIASGDLTYHGSYDVSAKFPAAVALGLLGAVSFVISYEAYLAIAARRHGERHASRRLEFRSDLVVRTAAIAAGAGLALFLFHLQRTESIVGGLRLMMQGRSQALTEATANSSEYLSSAPVLGACAAIAIASVSRSPTLRTRAAIVVMASIPVLIFLLIGNRRFIVPSIVIPIVVGFLVKGRRPRRSVVLPVAVAAFLLLAIIPYARSAGAREQAGGFLNIVTYGLSNPEKPATAFMTGYDTEMVVALAMQVESLEATGHYSFGRATVGDLLLAPVPSALFPSKPQTARNELLIDVTGVPCQTTGQTSCPDFSVVGTFYQDWHILGVILGMGALGWGAAAAWRRHLVQPRNPYRAVIVAVVVVQLPIIIRAGFMPAFSWSLYFVLPTLLILRLSQVQFKRGGAVSPSRPTAQ